MKKRVCSFLMAFVMMFSLLPAAVFAAEVESVTTYVTISNAGTLVTEKDGAFVAYAPVSVSDRNHNGTIDIDDALFAAHEQYYIGGAAAGYDSYTGAYGLSLSKLWGNDSGAFGYYVNDESAWSLADQVNDGDHIRAYIYRDTAAWSDKLARFKQP